MTAADLYAAGRRRSVALEASVSADRSDGLRHGDFLNARLAGQVVGNAALTIDRERGRVGFRLTRLASDETLRATLRAAGQSRSAAPECHGTLAVYRRAVRQSR
jgi:hypothetical protein